MRARVLRLDRHLCGSQVPGTAYVLMHHLMGEHQGRAVGVCARRMGASPRRSRARRRALACKSRRRHRWRSTGERRPCAGRAHGRRREFRAGSCLQCRGDYAVPAAGRGPALACAAVREIDTFRTFSTAFKMNIAATSHRATALRCGARAVRISDLRAHRPGYRLSRARLRRAKYGWYSRRPFLTAVVPTIVDDSLPCGQARR